MLKNKMIDSFNNESGVNHIFNTRLKAIAFWFVFCILATATITACAFSTTSDIWADPNKGVKIEQMVGITSEAADEIQQAADATTRFFINNTGMRLKNQVIIILTTDRRSYIDEIITKFKISELEAERVARGTHALSGKNLIIVDMSGIPTARQKTFLIAHELTHHYQRQIAGNRAGNVMWMLEGMAETVGAQVVAQQGYLQIEQYKNNWRTGLAKTADKPSLSQLKTSNDWSRSISQYGSSLAYKTAGLAVLMLTERFGQEKVLDYFAELRQGEDPEVTFQNIFGITMTDFIADVTYAIRKAA